MSAKSLRELDEQIRDAMQNGSAPPEKWEEQGLFDMVFEIFRGRMRWLNIYGWIVGAVFFALSIFSAVKFFQTDDVKAAMAWGLGFVFCMLAVSMMKLWFWMQMDKNAVLREIKRMELQIARLGASK